MTTDLGVSAFLLIAFYYLWRRLAQHESRSLYWSAVAMGAALASKFSAGMLFPLPILLLWILGGSDAARHPDGTQAKRAVAAKPTRKVHQGRSLRESQPGVDFRTALQWDRAKLVSIAIYFAVAALVVQLSYWGSLDPRLFFKGLAAVNKNHNPDYAGYLHGSYHIGSWWYYFLVAFLVKATAAFVLLVFARLALFVGRIKQEWLTAVFALSPAILFFVATSALADPLGIRYVLPVFPFLMVFSSGLLPLWSHKRAVVWPLCILLGWHVTSSMLAFPNHIPYFNEFAGGASHGTEWLDDSNVDWGQEMKVLKAALDEQGIKTITLVPFSPFDNPEYYGLQCDRVYEPPRVTPGYYVVSAHMYVRFRQRGFDFKRVSRLIGEVGHSMFIFQAPSLP